MDNVLVIIGDGRKAAVDMRLISPDMPDDPNSKLNVMVRNVKKLYDENPGTVQTVFYDLTKPDKDALFNVHMDMRHKLVEAGVPDE